MFSMSRNSKRHKESPRIILSDNDVHVSEIDIALYVDLLLAEQKEKITSNLKSHIDNCQECKSEMLKLRHYYDN